MGLFDKKNAVDAMEDLLDREREAILEGRFDLLGRLIEQKTRQVNALNPKDLDEKSLMRLRDQGQRNARLLEAMREGIEAVQQRLANLQGAGAALEIYEADGRRTKFLAAKKAETRRV